MHYIQNVKNQLSQKHKLLRKAHEWFLYLTRILIQEPLGVESLTMKAYLPFAEI